MKALAWKSRPGWLRGLEITGQCSDACEEFCRAGSISSKYFYWTKLWFLRLFKALFPALRPKCRHALSYRHPERHPISTAPPISPALAFVSHSSSSCSFTHHTLFTGCWALFWCWGKICDQSYPILALGWLPFRRIWEQPYGAILITQITNT